MSSPILWITGPPGSGKTTAGRTAAARLGIPFESAGEHFRALAVERGMGLAEFSRYAEAHEEVDRSLDERMMARARPGALLEGRVVGALLRRRGDPVHAVLVTAREEVRATRLAGRDGTDAATALERMRARSESERLRYHRFYGIDLDREHFDERIDASDRSREEVADLLTGVLRNALGGP